MLYRIFLVNFRGSPWKLLFVPLYPDLTLVPDEENCSCSSYADTILLAVIKTGLEKNDIGDIQLFKRRA